MSEKPYYHQDERQQLRTWALGQMMAGAGYAGAVLLVIAVFFLVLRLIAAILPEDPFAALETGSTLLSQLV